MRARIKMDGDCCAAFVLHVKRGMRAAKPLLTLHQTITVAMAPHGMSNETSMKDGDIGPLDTIEEHEYPGGLRLMAIVTALVLSIFLASLDTVR